MRSSVNTVKRLGIVGLVIAVVSMVTIVFGPLSSPASLPTR